jgi:hypothetical protein
MMPLEAKAMLALGVVGLAAFGGWKAATWRCEAARVESVERAARQAEEMAAQDREVLTAHEVRSARIRTVFQDVEKEVIRYVALHVSDADCLDAGGLRLWGLANQGPDAQRPGESVDAVPSLAAPGVGEGRGPAGEPRVDGEAVPRMPGATPGTGGLGVAATLGVAMKID